MPSYKFHRDEGKFSAFICSVRRELEDNPDLPHKLAREIVIGAVIGAGAFLVYLLTLCPTVYGTEGGELVAAAATLGIPRPTGYPLYLLLGHLLLAAFPNASPAYVMNLFSAAAASAAVVITYVLARTLLASRSIAAATALGLAFSLSLWSQATIAGPYSLVALFSVLCLHYTFCWYKNRKDYYIARFALVAGLGLAVHPAILANVVVMLVLVFITYRRPAHELPRLGRLLARMLIGLSLYAYFPIRAALHPALQTAEVGGAAGFFRYLLSPGYWERAPVESLGDILRVLMQSIKVVPSELTWLGAALVVLSIFAIRKQDWRLPGACLVCFGANVAPLMLHGHEENILLWWSHYLIPGYVGLTILAGFGLKFLYEKLRIRPAGYAVAVLFPLLMLQGHYQQADKSGNYIAYDYAFSILDTLPNGATLICRSDAVLYSILYLKYAEGMRPDIRLVVAEGEAPLELGVDTETKGLYLTHHIPLRDSSLVLVPHGLTYRVEKQDVAWEPIPPEEVHPLRDVADERLQEDQVTKALIARFYYMMGMGYAGVDQAHAFRLFRKAGKLSGDNAAMHYDLGMAYMRLGMYDEAQFEFERVVALNPSHPNAAARVGQVELLRGKREMPTLEEKQEVTDYLERARGFTDEGNIVRAVQELRQAVSLDPRSFEAHNKLAAAYLKLELYNLAQREWEAALKIRPSDPAVLANLSRVRNMMEWREAPNGSSSPEAEQ